MSSVLKVSVKQYPSEFCRTVPYFNNLWITAYSNLFIRILLFRWKSAHISVPCISYSELLTVSQLWTAVSVVIRDRIFFINYTNSTTEKVPILQIIRCFQNRIYSRTLEIHDQLYSSGIEDPMWWYLGSQLVLDLLRNKALTALGYFFGQPTADGIPLYNTNTISHLSESDKWMIVHANTDIILFGKIELLKRLLILGWKL